MNNRKLISSVIILTCIYIFWDPSLLYSSEKSSTDSLSKKEAFLTDASLLFRNNPIEADSHLKSIYQKALEIAEQNKRLNYYLPHLKYAYAKMRLLKGSDIEIRNLSIEMKRMADQGDLNAQNRYALMLLNGEGVKQDMKKARFYYEKAAKQGDFDAQYNYAVMLRDSEGGKEDLEGALQYFKMSADQGYSLACYNYGLMLYQGKGCRKNLEKARENYKVSANLGFVSAQHNYASMLYTGQGGEKNLDEARAYFQLASKQGHRFARYNYAVMLFKGEGGKKDLKEALALTNSIDEKDDKHMNAEESQLVRLAKELARECELHLLMDH